MLLSSCSVAVVQLEVARNNTCKTPWNLHLFVVGTSIIEQVTEGRRYHNSGVSLLEQITPDADGTVQGTKLAVFKRRL